MRHPWMLDNGAFSSTWDVGLWRKRLRDLVPHLSTCIGTIVPDTILDPHGTLTKWRIYSAEVKALGYKAFFATQNGCTVDMIPWQEIDGLFIGGSDAHRQSECFPLIRHALDLGLWVHVGRVNSARNIIRYCMCDSVDGTTFVFDNSRLKMLRIRRAVNLCKNRKTLQGKLFSAV